MCIPHSKCALDQTNLHFAIQHSYHLGDYISATSATGPRFSFPLWGLTYKTMKKTLPEPTRFDISATMCECKILPLLSRCDVVEVSQLFPEEKRRGRGKIQWITENFSDMRIKNGLCVSLGTWLPFPFFSIVFSSFCLTFRHHVKNITYRVEQ